MAKARTVFTCRECDAQSPKWVGRCPECGAWDALSEQAVRPATRRPSAVASQAPTAIGALDPMAIERQSSGQPALDRVLGGGVVPGAAVLLAGEPGIGKSTLLLQLGAALAGEGRRVLYVSAEESPSQLRLRAERLDCVCEGLDVLGETSVEAVMRVLDGPGYDTALIDSVQALRSDELSSTPGSASQLRTVANLLVEQAKGSSKALFLVGHVTKDGSIAGPKSLEHLVDTVLTFEGERHAEHRILRATKNRFGATGEIALFEMRDKGLVEVDDASRVLLSQDRGAVPGSAVGASVLGTRPMLFEVQALVHPTSFPAPRRMSVGLDPQRVTLLVAILERFGSIALSDRDLFLNVIGGLAIREPAADLATAAAILSTALERPLPRDAVYVGELGLLGEARPVSRIDARLKEAAALGFRKAYVASAGGAVVKSGDLEVVPIRNVTSLRQTISPSAGVARGGGGATAG